MKQCCCFAEIVAIYQVIQARANFSVSLMPPSDTSELAMQSRSVITDISLLGRV
jgi:hypothetical protein